MIPLSARHAYNLLDLVATCIEQVDEHVIRMPGKIVVGLTEEARARHAVGLEDKVCLVLSSFALATALSRQTRAEKEELYHVYVRVRALWQQTLETLEHPEASALSAKLDPKIIQAMRTIARKLGWTSPFTDTFVHPPRPTTNWHDLRYQGCHYVHCLCFGSKARHQLYVCKGCWKAAYCSKDCQQ